MKITLLMLHLKHGGIEKQMITLANLLVEKYDVEMIVTYNINDICAYHLDSRVLVKYLLPYGPNRDAFKQAIKSKHFLKALYEFFRALKILYLKQHCMIKAIRSSKADAILSSRIETSYLLSKYGSKKTLKIAQEHNYIDTCKYGKKVVKAMKNIDYLVLMSDIATDLYKNWLYENKHIKFAKIPNMLDHIPEASTSLINKQFITAGRLHPVKDFTSLIEAFNIVYKVHNDYKLVIVGDGEERSKLENLIKKYGISKNVTITGMVSSEEVEHYFMESSIFVMTSVTECFPMVLLEANSCSLPVISFSIASGPLSIIKNGYNGYLTAGRDVKALASKMIETMENSDKLKEMSTNSKVYATGFLPNNIMKLWYNIFDERGND